MSPATATRYTEWTFRVTPITEAMAHPLFVWGLARKPGVVGPEQQNLYVSAKSRVYTLNLPHRERFESIEVREVVRHLESINLPEPPLIYEVDGVLRDTSAETTTEIFQLIEERWRELIRSL